MSQPANKKFSIDKVLQLVLIGFLAYFGLQMFFAPNPKNAVLSTGEIGFTVDKDSFELHENVGATIQNNTTADITIPSRCPNEPVKVLTLQNGTWSEIPSYSAKIDCSTIKEVVIKPKEQGKVSFHNWTNGIFKQPGFYKLETEVNGKKYESNQFQIVPQGIFSQVWSTAFYQPLYNGLIWLIQIIPGRDLGLAIILLTFLIRTILLVPSLKAQHSQTKLQNIQPKINEIKQKHASDQQRQAQEIMALYKEHKVSPFGSCLPLLIQFPILIAIFNVIQNGLNPDQAYLLYPALSNFDLSTINTMFLGILDLTKVNFIVLPIVVAGLQFLQLKLASLKTDREAKAKKTAEKTSAPKPNDNSMAAQMDIMNKSMKFVLPVMIGIFTASAPAGVGLYWGFSTLYSIGQQLYINRKNDLKTTTVSEVKMSNKEKKEAYKQKHASNKSNTDAMIESDAVITEDHTDKGNSNGDDTPITKIRI